jgi:hypothetical protein
MRVRLTKKFAEVLDGVDLKQWRVGDVFLVTRHEAELLLAEGWAEPVPDDAVAESSADGLESQRLRPSADALRLIRLGMDAESDAARQRRRLEDRIREQLRDARAKTILPEDPR